MGRKSKEKGSQYERDISRKLSEWVTGSNDEIIFWRQGGSGSIGTIQKKKGLSAKNVDGDFQYIGNDLKQKELVNVFFIDSKNLGKVHLMLVNPKNNKSNQLFKEIRKVFKDAKSSNKIPFLFIKATNDRKISDFIIVPKYVKIFCNNFILYNIRFEETVYEIQLVLQDEFFELNNWEDLIEKNKKILNKG